MTCVGEIDNFIFNAVFSHWVDSHSTVKKNVRLFAEMCENDKEVN